MFVFHWTFSSSTHFRILGRILWMDTASPDFESAWKWRNGKKGIRMSNTELVLATFITNTGEPEDPGHVGTTCSTPCTSFSDFHSRHKAFGSEFSLPNVTCLHTPWGCPIMHNGVPTGSFCTLVVSSKSNGSSWSKLFFFASSSGYLIVIKIKSNLSSPCWELLQLMEKFNSLSTLQVTPRSSKTSSES